MRGTGWLLPIVAMVIWIATVMYPAIAAMSALAAQPHTAVTIRSAGTLLATSTGWAAMVAVGAMVLGWIPGRLLGKSLNRKGFVPLATLMLVPICLPAYVVFYAWWQSWPAETAIYQWAVNHQQIPTLRLVTLLVGLLCWSWPLVAWCVAGSVASTPAQREELLELDGAGRLTRWLDYLRTDFRGLALGGLLVFLATINNTTCFDLSEVFTFANELRAVEALGASTRDAMVAAMPAMAIAAAGAMLVWGLLSTRLPGEARRTLRTSRSSIFITAAIWIVSVLLPIALFTRSVIVLGRGGAVLDEFVRLYWRSVFNTIGLAFLSGSVGALVAIGLAAGWQDHRRWVRWLAHVQAVGWLFAAIVPGTIVGVALASAYDRAALSTMLFQNPLILSFGHLASFGFVAALLGWWIVSSEPQRLCDLRQLDSAFTLPAMIRSNWPRVVAGGIATLAIVFSLAIGETPVTARLNPPMPAGAGPLSLTILNDMHYQRPQTVMVGTLLMMALAIVAAIVVTLIWKFVRKPSLATIVACLIITTLIGCIRGDGGDAGSDAARPLKTQFTFGAGGTALGQFNYPRCIDVDPNNHWLYVVDKSARVQRFSFDGQPLKAWSTPESANGKPTGMTVAPDGRVFVADTHYFRVLVYDSDGNLLTKFGSYGEKPMQFIYPTDIAFGPNDWVYVSEYGGHDRIQVFDLSEKDPKYLFEFGSFGSERGQFSRPQAMAFNKDKTELFITDACNHRIVVTDPKGNWLRTFGTAGRGVGELTYPYGMVMFDDGTIMVAEFGNNRIQHFDPQGRSLGVLGRIGRNQGELQYPWGVATYGDQIFVLDSGNNRVQVIRKP